MLCEDGSIAGVVDLGPRIDSVEPVRDERSQVGGVGGRVTKEELLRWDGA